MPPPPPPLPPPPSAAAAVDPKTIDPNRILNVNVGVLGHVDSGKTSLVKTLSTLLSTASLDRSSQSRQRGITLDLGFSAFLMAPVPPRIAQDPRYCEDGEGEGEGGDSRPRRCRYDALQITLVDCPGHASLIRTIIGGAQIIDMVLLVVDANKGVQTQTAECIVIAEMTCRDMIVVLNKVDLLGGDDGADSPLRSVEARVRGVLRSTKFGDCQMVGVSACVGGEKVAAVVEGDSKDGAGAGAGPSAPGPIPTRNIDGLLRLLTSTLRPPVRDGGSLAASGFRFSIDHCFPIRGQGTVLTGTVLAGDVAVGDQVEFPTLGAIQRKVKSMQMFRRKVERIRQGDRAGICISNFDPKLMERGIASSPGTVRLIDGAIAVVRKVRYFRGGLASGAKFHVSVGHSTVMATVTFWGRREIQQALRRRRGEEREGRERGHDVDTGTGSEGNWRKTSARGSSSLGGDADVAGLPHLPFDYGEDFLHQDGYLESMGDDTDEGGGNSSNGDGGGDNEEDDDNGGDNGMPLHWALLHFQTPVYCPLDSLVIGSRLDTDINVSTCRLAFSGRLVERYDPKMDADRIRVYTPKQRTGVVCRLGDPYRREEDGKVVRYEVYGTDLFKKETNMTQFVGMKIVTDRGDIGCIQSSFGTSGKFKAFFPAGTDVREGDNLNLKFKRYTNDAKKEMVQDMVLPQERVGTRLDPTGKKKKKKSAPHSKNGKKVSGGAARGESKSSAKVDADAIGEIVSLKGEAVNGRHEVVIVQGLFAPEINIRHFVGRGLGIVGEDDGASVGKVSGPFGKAGKCKVSFECGLGEDAVGKKVNLLPPEEC